MSTKNEIVNYFKKLGWFIVFVVDAILYQLEKLSPGMFNFLIWVAVAWLWYAATHSITILAKKTPKVIGYALIIIGFTISTVLCCGGKNKPEEPEPTIMDLAQKVDETNKRLAELSQLKANEESRLATEYPLGYAMIALSGDKNIVLPYTDRFETDWDNIKVYKDDKNIVWIEIPYLRDKRLNSQFTTTSLGLPATPGSKSIKLRFKGSFTAQATCLRANPVGIYLVLGFAEDSQSKP